MRHVSAPGAAARAGCVMWLVGLMASARRARGARDSKSQDAMRPRPFTA